MARKRTGQSVRTLVDQIDMDAPNTREWRPWRAWRVEVRRPGWEPMTWAFRTEKPLWDWVDPWPWETETEVTVYHWRPGGWTVYEVMRGKPA